MCSISYPSCRKNNCKWSGSLYTGQMDQLAPDYSYKIVLIDGNRLADLMIEYELGVLTQYIYQVKQIDRDYFSEE